MYIFETATQAFEAIFGKIIKEGISTEIGTRAIYNCMFTIRRPENRVITTPWRKFSNTYAEREWQWYITGNPSVEEIQKHAPMWGKMHNGNFLVQSNYGWQWMRNGQLKKCIDQLKECKYTRQAWISIYDGKEKDNYKFDTPCTLAVGFDVKASTSSYLDMTVMMRSNDLVYGFCNDQYCFSKLQEMVANELGLYVGTYTHIAHDMHIYNEQLNMVSDYYKKLSEKYEIKDEK